jgi:uncharacterized protein GlcG (DUF336 family)
MCSQPREGLLSIGFRALYAAFRPTDEATGDIMTLRLFAIAFATFFLTASPSSAQQAPAPYGAPITLDMAKKIMAAAEAEAVKNNWQVVITIIDSGGHMVMMQKSDNTQLASISASEGKAQTSLAFKLPSKALEDAIAAGGPGTRLLALKNIAPFEGGLPILVDGKIVGAIGVSGALSSQDAQIARAGLGAIAN